MVDTITVFSSRGHFASSNTFRRAWARSLLLPVGILLLWTGAVFAAADDTTGLLPKALGVPPWCNYSNAYDLNGGSYADDLVVVGSLGCPTETSLSASLPYMWRNGSWSALELPEGNYDMGFAESVSEDPTVPLTVVYELFYPGDAEGAGQGWQTWVLTEGQALVQLSALPDMTFISNGSLSGQGNHIVGGNSSGDWESGFTYRAVRWTRDGAGWSAPEDIGEGRAIATTDDGSMVIGNGDGETSGATGGNPWLWVAREGGGGELTSLGGDARVYGIAQDGSMIVGSRAEPCTNGNCDFFPAPVYWTLQDGQWVMHDLQALDGVDSSAVAVAEVDGRMIIVGEGFSKLYGGIARSVVWMPNAGGDYGPAMRLETIGANFETVSWPADINAQGIILGWSEFEPWGNGADVLWSLLEEFPFAINSGLGDAWFNPQTDGQGFFVNVWEDIQTMFVGWFTYADDGSGRHWMTAQGPYTEGRAELEITLSEGGAFDSGQPAPMRRPDGSMTVEFRNCLEGNVTYDIPSMGRQGSVPIQRLARGNVAACEKRAAGVR